VIRIVVLLAEEDEMRRARRLHDARVVDERAARDVPRFSDQRMGLIERREPMRGTRRRGDVRGARSAGREERAEDEREA